MEVQVCLKQISIKIYMKNKNKTKKVKNKIVFKKKQHEVNRKLF